MKIAVWYHCKLSGIGIPDPSDSFAIVSEQMLALKSSGLADAAAEIHAGIIGGIGEAKILSSIVPSRTMIHAHGPESGFERPTLVALQKWVPSHRDWLILYHHSKGVTQPKDEFHNHHRRTMEKWLVWNWRTCVEDLSRGFDLVGINIVDPISRPAFGNLRFLAGNFWWATAKHLLRLPQLTLKSCNRLEDEQWIGRSRVRPIMMDYERPEKYQLKEHSVLC